MQMVLNPIAVKYFYFELYDTELFYFTPVIANLLVFFALFTLAIVRLRIGLIIYAVIPVINMIALSRNMNLPSFYSVVYGVLNIPIFMFIKKVFFDTRNLPDSFTKDYSHLQLLLFNPHKEILLNEIFSWVLLVLLIIHVVWSFFLLIDSGEDRVKLTVLSLVPLLNIVAIVQLRSSRRLNHLIIYVMIVLSEAAALSALITNPFQR